MQKKNKRSIKKAERKRRSLQELFGLMDFGQYGLQTTWDDVVFFRV